MDLNSAVSRLRLNVGIVDVLKHTTMYHTKLIETTKCIDIG